MKPAIAVIGAGVIGLTTSIRLIEQGFAVTILARDVKDELTSRAAPAIWMPYKASPEEKISAWAEHSLSIYQKLTAAEGIEKKPLYDYNRTNELPMWAKVLKNYRELPAEELLPTYSFGCTGETVVIDSSIYVDYLMQQFKKLGGNLIQQTITRLDDVAATFDTLVNCSGVGAGELVPDEAVFPIRGQYLLIEKPKHLDRIIFATPDDKGYTIIVPRQHDCYIGGTTLVGNWSKTIDPVTTEQIRQNVAAVMPELATCKTLYEGVGLRPGRNAVRLETEILSSGRRIVHNYGHGGSGFTVCWGCAEDVVELVMN